MNIKQHAKRWARGALVLGGTTIAIIAMTRVAQSLSSAQVDNTVHHQGGFVENLADLPWTLAPTYAADASEQTIEMPVGSGPYTPDGSKSDDVYHCFALNPHLTRDSMVVGAEVLPGNRKIVHHAILYKVEPSLAAGVLAKDNATGGKGWDCFGGPGLTDNPAAAATGGNWLAVWVPGANDGHFPNEVGNPMPKGSVLVMEVHYNLVNGVGQDQSKVKLTVAPEGKKLTPITSRLRVAPVEIRCPDQINTPECTREATLRENVARAGFLAGDVLPNSLLSSCGQTAAQYQKPVGDGKNIIMSCDQVNSLDMRIYSIGGHMHTLAKSIKIELNPGSSNAKTLLHIPKWDFHWQGNYWFKNPVEVKRGDVIRTTCTFDNSVENQPEVRGKRGNPKYVMWAEATSDEMCLGILMAHDMGN